MRVFWREEPLTPDELELWEALREAHYRSCFRGNPSTVALQCAAEGSGDFCRAVAAALMTLGGVHGPVEEVYGILVEGEAAVERYLGAGRKLPGWGGSFMVNGRDEIWGKVERLLRERFEDEWAVVEAITLALRKRGIKAGPNPSAFTALTAIVLGMPPRLAPYLLVAARLDGWAEIFMQVMSPRETLTDETKD